MGLNVFRESVEAEDNEDVHILVIDHEADVTEAAGSLEGVLRDLSPEDQVDEDLGDLL